MFPVSLSIPYLLFFFFILKHLFFPFFFPSSPALRYLLPHPSTPRIMQLQRNPSAFAVGRYSAQLQQPEGNSCLPGTGLGGERGSPVRYLTITSPFRDRHQGSLIAKLYALLAA